MDISCVPAKTIVTKTKDSRWFGVDYNMNIYRGCCHGCVYCDSRSECYQIQDFDQVKAKKDALVIIRNDLRRKVKTGVVGTGSMSDPYNPFEKELKLTRHAMELVDAYGFGMAVATKSALMLRDMDILESIKDHSPVLCKVTVTTADDALAKKIEPNVSSPSQRLDMIARLSEKGIFTGILLMPVLPFLEDNKENIMSVVRCAHQAGARFIYAVMGMTLRGNQREWYFDRLEELFPGQRLRERYLKAYGGRYECASPGARELWKMFEEECQKYGILYKMDDIIHASRRPYETTQLSLFDL